MTESNAGNEVSNDHEVDNDYDVAIVGAGIADGSRAIADAIAALGPVPVYMASLSATGINFTLVIDDAEVVAAMQRLHRTFFESAA